jgi:multidrug efflux pump subunit AcrA (membrane-fusion protein)
MHPQIVSDHPGNCPLCQMRLRRVADGGRAGPVATAATPAGRKVKFYRHPMRSDVISETPATDEMGMPYTPVYEGDEAAAGGDVPGHAAFTLSAERQQLIGVTRGRVATRALAVDVRTVGRVAYDPALYRAIVDYREAVRSRATLGADAREEARAGSGALVRGAYLRLRQQGLSDEQVQAFTRGDRDPVELLLPSDAVWVYAQVYEYEAPLIQPGQAMSITVPSVPGPEFAAKVAAIDPILDPTTRTVRVRGLVATPQKQLRPESFVEVTIHVPLGDELAVPSEAVLDTGRHQYVFVVDAEGRFQPRAVTVGRLAQGYYEVLAGLRDGEEVVTSANFLIDSESRFRAALAAFEKPKPAAE